MSQDWRGMEDDDWAQWAIPTSPDHPLGPFGSGRSGAGSDFSGDGTAEAGSDRAGRPPERWGEDGDHGDPDDANRSGKVIPVDLTVPGQARTEPAPRAATIETRSLGDLQRMQGELWAALRREDDPELRMALLSQLSDIRAAMMARIDARAADVRPGDLWGAGAGGGGSVNRPGPGYSDTGPDTGGRGADGPSRYSRPVTPGSRVMSRRPPSLVSEPDVPPPPGPGDEIRPNLALQFRAGIGRLGDPHSGQRMAVLTGALISALTIGWLVLGQPFSPAVETSAGSPSPAGPSEVDTSSRTAKIVAVLQSMGMSAVSVEQRGDDVIHLSGTVETEAERATVVGVVEAMSAGDATVTSDLIVQNPAASVFAVVDDSVSARARSLQSEINRLVATTPLIFETGKTELTELHIRILNNVATVLRAYPGFQVSVIGYTDDVGAADANDALSSLRAESVKAYLVAQGVPETDLFVEARGSATSTGSAELASLERRVEFEVVVPVATPASSSPPPLRIALVAPSASNDLAFTQSMVDAIGVVASERGGVEIDITDNTFVPEEAAAAIRRYAENDYDLIIAHGVEFGTELLAIVTEYPEIIFAWGTATDTFDLPNLYAYDAAAEQGGYVMGAMAARLTATDTVGVVGPIEVADAVRYIEGFNAGVVSQKPSADVPVTYTGSFGDIAAASETAANHIGAGADVLTGTAEMVVGAIAVARTSNVPWFGTQANQASLAPEIVVASQVYHWEVLLRQVVADLDAGTPDGRALLATMANGGLVLEYNPSYPLPEGVRQLGDQLANDIGSGALVVPAD